MLINMNMRLTGRMKEGEMTRGKGGRKTGRKETVQKRKALTAPFIKILDNFTNILIFNILSIENVNKMPNTYS